MLAFPDETSHHSPYYVCAASVVLVVVQMTGAMPCLRAGARLKPGRPWPSSRLGSITENHPVAFPLNDEESLGNTLSNVKGDPGQGTQTQKPGRAAGGLLYLRSRTVATAPEATTEMSVKRQKMLTRIVLPEGGPSHSTMVGIAGILSLYRLGALLLLKSLVVMGLLGCHA